MLYSHFALRMETVQLSAMMRFTLRSYLLMSWMSCISMVRVFQANTSVTAPVGGSAVLDCYTTADPVVHWFWLKQIPGQKLNSIASIYYQKIKLHEEFLSVSRPEVKVNGNKTTLIFTKITSTDAAYYHCGVLWYEKLYFGDGSYLTVNDVKPVKVIQQPISDSHYVGNSVTLHCSIFGETCSGVQSVYWLKYEHPGLIYTDGDRKDQCEKKISVSGSTVQNCVYNVPKSPVSDETHFCSVVSCGKLTIGNGTTLISDVIPQKTIFYISALLSALLVISVIVNIITVLSWRRATQRGVDKVQSTAQTADIDSENYASLKFCPHRPKHTIKSLEEEETVVYAPVRQTRSVKQGSAHS